MEKSETKSVNKDKNDGYFLCDRGDLVSFFFKTQQSQRRRKKSEKVKA